MKSSRFSRKYEFSLWVFFFFYTNVHAFRLYAVSVPLVYVNSTFTSFLNLPALVEIYTLF